MDDIFTCECDGDLLTIGCDANDNLTVEIAGGRHASGAFLTKHQTTELLEVLHNFRLSRFYDSRRRIALAVAAMHMAAANFPEGTAMELTRKQMNDLAKAALGLG